MGKEMFGIYNRYSIFENNIWLQIKSFTKNKNIAFYKKIGSNKI